MNRFFFINLKKRWQKHFSSVISFCLCNFSCTKHNVRDTCAFLRALVLDYMCVVIVRCADLGMAELMRYRNHIQSVRNQHTGYRMPECVRIDMRQTSALTEQIQPVGNAVRVHRPSVVTGEHKIISVPAIAIGNAQFFLARFMRTQQLHRFFRQADIAKPRQSRGRSRIASPTVRPIPPSARMRPAHEHRS